MTRTDPHPPSGLTAQRFAQLVEQRRYELNVGAGGLEALLEPYAVAPTLTIPGQRQAPDEN